MEISCSDCYDVRLKMTGVILAGGRSSRLTGKSLLEISGAPVIERIIRKLDPLFNELIIITDAVEDYLEYRISLLSDIIPGKGPLGGIYTGLSVASNNTVFVVACDMPFLNLQLIKYMSSFTSEYDIVVPYNDKGFETLHAFYSKKCTAKCGELIHSDKLQVAGLFSYFKTRKITLEEIESYDREQLSYFNMNTPQEYDAARKIASSQQNRVKNAMNSGDTKAQDDRTQADRDTMMQSKKNTETRGNRNKAKLTFS